MDINTQLLGIYWPMAEEDIRAAQNYIKRRESAAHGLSYLIDAMLKDAAEDIARLCYRYDVDPMKFSISTQYNKALFRQIAAILDKLEEDIMDAVLDYSTRCTESEKRKTALLPWILALGRGGRNLRQTLESRLRMFMRDIEAMVAALRLTRTDMTKAITRIRSSLHTVYVMPEVRAAYAESTAMKAEYLRTRGVKHGNVGNSNSEANNILRFGEITVQMAWMRNQLLNYRDRGAEGYVVVRGSSYPCDICESHVGWHPIEDIDSYPQYHGHCKCTAIPVYRNTYQKHR